MSNSISGGIVDVGFGVRCCLSVNSTSGGIWGVVFVVRCCLSSKFDKWRDLGCYFCCKMLFECQN